MEQPTGTYAEQITRWWGSMWGSQNMVHQTWRVFLEDLGGDHGIYRRYDGKIMGK